MFKKNEPEVVREPLEGSLMVRESSTLPVRTGQQNSSSATIGVTIRLSGDLYGEEDVLVQGCIEGTVNLRDNMLTVGEHGKVNATINAHSMEIQGQVSGDLNCEEQVIVRNSGRVQGNIIAPRVTLEDGCYFKGSIDMDLKEDDDQRGANVADLKPATESKKISTGAK